MDEKSPDTFPEITRKRTRDAHHHHKRSGKERNFMPISKRLLKRRTDADVGCTEDGQDGRIGATKYAGGNGARKEVEKWDVQYNAGVKDLASAYVLCPRLAECGVFRFTDGTRFTE